MAVPPSFRYPLLLRCMHWSAVLLVALAYLTAESAEEGGAGGQVHVLAGLALLLVVLPWLALRIGRRKAPPPQAGLQAWAARLVHLALFLFIVVQPMLGVLATWCEGEPLRVPWTGWQVPPLLVLGEAWEDRLEDLHAGVGNVFYGVIALHALAALWHQFVRRDGTLRRMAW